MLRRVNKELYPYVSRVLKKDGIQYSVIERPDFYEVVTGIASRRFNVIIEDAKCEEERECSACPDIPVVSYKTAINPAKVAKIMKEFNADCFVLLRSDEARFAHAIA